VIYDEKSGKVITAERGSFLKRTSLELALKRIYALLEEAESVTDESEDWEIKIASSRFHEALGASNNMATLGLFLGEHESKLLSFKQRIIGEKLTRLREKRALDTANI